MELVLGERIKKLRLESGMSQCELGRRVGFTKQGISKLENNLRKYYDFTLIEKLAYELRCTSDYLIGLSEDTHLTHNGLKVVIFKDPSHQIKEELYELYLKNKELGDAFIDCAKELTNKEQLVIVNSLRLILSKKNN